MADGQDDSREAVARRLEQVRNLMQMDKQTFAAKMDMSPQAYGSFENGTRDLSLEAAKKIRKAYGVSLEFLYFGNKADLPHKMATQL